MSGILEENTLGVVVGRARKAAGTAARRLGRTGTVHRASLGTAFLGLGAAIVVALRAVYGLSWFLVLWPQTDYPQPALALAAWIVLLAVVIAAIVTARVIGDRLPDWMFAVFLAGLVAAVGLDVAAVWGTHDIGSYATAGVTAIMALLAVVTLRGRWELLIAAGVGGLGLVVAMLLDARPESLTDPAWLASQLDALALAVLPVVIGVVVVEGFRRMVQVELDRVLVQSTVQAPRFAVGMLASEELARLDLAAEELFERIADGRTELPLHPKTASVAASLATELRLHLIEGRRETWLYHAVSESELLGKHVSLSDKSSLAGLLDPVQRDGLLATAWLLVSDSGKSGDARSVSIQLGPVDPTTTPAPEGKIAVPITITTTGIARNRVDPSIWDAIARVGKYADSTHDSSLRVDIVCLVDNPAEN
ncbi:MAG: hypothetical protein J0G30_08020 [Actinomycetales bacterium]|nr:hypothetical protein [Actinomycetales bacterium]